MKRFILLITILLLFASFASARIWYIVKTDTITPQGTAYLVGSMRVGDSTTTYNVFISSTAEILLNGGTYWMDITRTVGFTISDGSASFTNNGGGDWYTIGQGSYVAVAGYAGDAGDSDKWDGLDSTDTFVSAVKDDGMAGNLSMENGKGVKFLEAGGTNYFMLRSTPTMASDVEMYLPADNGTAGQVLATDGTDNFYFTAAGAGDILIVYSRLGWTFPFSAYVGTGLGYDSNIDTFTVIAADDCIEIRFTSDGIDSANYTGFDIKVDSGTGSFNTIMVSSTTLQVANTDRCSATASDLVQAEYPSNTDWRFDVLRTTNPAGGSPIIVNIWGSYKINE